MRTPCGFTPTPSTCFTVRRRFAAITTPRDSSASSPAMCGSESNAQNSSLASAAAPCHVQRLPIPAAKLRRIHSRRHADINKLVGITRPYQPPSKLQSFTPQPIPGPESRLARRPSPHQANSHIPSTCSPKSHLPLFSAPLFSASSPQPESRLARRPSPHQANPRILSKCSPKFPLPLFSAPLFSASSNQIQVFEGITVSFGITTIPSRMQNNS